jgi:hypothetical protein
MRIAPTQASPSRTTPFVHIAWTPATSDDEYRNQRYFQGVRYPDKEHDIGFGMRVGENTEVTVYRDAHHDVARLSLYVSMENSVAELRACLCPSTLRELAQRLLDAAHDIDVNPSCLLQEAA